MENVILDNSERTYALKRPQGWKPKLPRWTLHLPAHVQELAVAYIGIQYHAGPWRESRTAIALAQKIESWSQDDCQESPIITEEFEVISGRDNPASLVFNCYWLSHERCRKSLAKLDLESLWRDQGSTAANDAVGIWYESFTPQLDRFETNYSGDDYRPGISRMEGARQLEHGLTGYWGAARDRIPASAHDDFSDMSSPQSEPDFTKVTKGKVLKGANSSIIAHIRSGQYWARCDDVEREAYERDLEPHLKNGLNDILANPTELGDYGLRFLRNIPRGLITAAGNAKGSKPEPEQESHELHRETCAAGFFRSLKDLESWAKNCPSHHRIYGGSVNHRKRFGSDAKMRTWHEICVLYPNEASWVYVNCLPGTGTIPFQESSVNVL